MRGQAGWNRLLSLVPRCRQACYVVLILLTGCAAVPPRKMHVTFRMTLYDASAALAEGEETKVYPNTEGGSHGSK